MNVFMLVMTSFVGFAVTLAPPALTPQLSSSSGVLGTGDPAPPLSIADWILGEPVNSLTDGPVTLVVFWATWCEASRASIPILNSLHRTFGPLGVRTIAVASRDAQGESVARVRGFVRSLSPGIEYSVAFDDRRRTLRAWMDAADQEFIPTAFIVDRTGSIAWIGSPLWPPGELDDALAGVLRGNFGQVEREAVRVKWSGLLERIRDLEERVQQAQVQGRSVEAAQLFDDLIAANPRTAAKYAGAKFELLLTPGQEEKAYEFARLAVDGPMRSDPAALNQLAWSILDNPGLRTRDFKLALRVALRADELSSGKDAAILDTTAKAYQCLGDIENAIKYQAVAVEHAEGEYDREEYNTRLEEYRSLKRTQRR